MNKNLDQSDSLSKDLVESTRQVDHWMENLEKDGQKAEGLEIINVGVICRTGSEYGGKVFERRLGLLHFNQDATRIPDFAKGVPYYVDKIVEEFRAQLIGSIASQLSEDPWSQEVQNRPRPMTQTTSQPKSSEVSEESELESPVVSNA